MTCLGRAISRSVISLILFTCIRGFVTVTVGDWGPWTDWSGCSKTCGHGVMYRQRTCHQVLSSCSGNKKQFRICNAQNCRPDTLEREGVAECMEQNSKIFGGKKFVWEPFRNPYKRCELSCKANGHHYYSSLRKILSDGTSCKHDNISFCLSGLCVTVGCDDILGSDAKLDKCGICDGNGKSCQVISGIFTRPHLPKYGHNFVTKIPKGACNINITEMAKSKNFLALKLTNDEYLLNSNRHLSRTGHFQGAGTEFQYYKNTGASCPGGCIYSSGPTNHSIDVEILYYHRNPGIIYQFTIPHDQVSQLGIPSVDKTNQNPDKENQHQNKNHRKHRKHPNRNRRRHKKHSQATTRTEQQDEVPVEQSNRHRVKDDRYIIRRRIDADHLNPQIQFGESPRYIPSIREGYQQQVLGSHGTHHQNQLKSRQLNTGHGSRHNGNRLDRQSVLSNSEHYGTGGVLPSSSLTLSNPHNAVNNPYSQDYLNVLESHDVNLIDNTGLYSWRLSGFTDCSRSCGGGTQQTRVLCMKGISNVEVTDENCNPRTKPQIQKVECNNSPCPADWFTGNWSSCSVTCGTGKQTRLVECRRRISKSLDVSVSASLCLDKQRHHRTKRCHNEPCATWKTGNWSKCTAECGHGQRTREITCVNANGIVTDDQICEDLKPEVTETCDMGSCAKGWYHTKWSEECSSECGRGFYTRNIYCAAEDGSSIAEKKCPIAKKPKPRKSCKSSQPCGGNWFAGPWLKCNATCGIGAINRGVVCMKKLRSDVYAIVKDVNCLAEDKPISVKGCEELPACGASWYMTEYSQCSKSCGTGVKRREVKCLNSDLKPDMTCEKNKRPTERQSCNKESCEKAHFSLQKDSGGDGCKDSYQDWCQFVKQARICGYKYYQTQCCQSCQEYL